MIMPRRFTHGLAGVALLGAGTSAVMGQQSVVDSVHNLSVSGPGDVRASGESEVCVFCHAPHRTSEVRPLWNRGEPTTVYQIYNSSALEARPGQPTGASKMCLSCHDGSIALGAVLSRDAIIQMAGAVSTMPAGPANLGSDLSDDHPISFPYDAALAAADPGLADPHAIDPRIVLDAADELQCTACHDAHDDSFGDFLVMDNSASDLCSSCHTLMDTSISEHESCAACHQPHTALSGPFLLRGADATEACLRCHDGSEHRAANIQLDLDKISAHAGQEIIVRRTSPLDQSRSPHTGCTDCHDPHTMHEGAAARAPTMAPNLGLHPTDFDAAGRSHGQATFEYEVCFRCHDDQRSQRRFPLVARAIVEPSTRRQFDPSGPSFHPVMAPGRNSDVPSLRPGWTEGSQMYCSDCHGSDSSRKAGGSGPNGVHGSNEPPLLLARYDRFDATPESAAAYALCYRCHERDGRGGILSDESFPHRVHVVDGRASCSTCHDAHGISSQRGNRVNNSHLINFDTSIVFPDPVTGRREFEDRGRFSGSCALTCHGVAHSPLDY